MRTLFRRGVPLILALIMLLCAPFPAFAERRDENGNLLYMAYNFYAGPDLSKTSRKFDSFMIDFRADKTPPATYWSLVNFGLDLSSKQTKTKYPSISGGGAYAGLQHTSARVGILSFWDMKYKNGRDTVVMTATRVYPKGSSTFGGEGEGTNCIMQYNWKDNQWYRMLLHSWEDSETGTTFAGTWFLDVESGQWQLFSYFNTNLYDSCFIGGMTQFMENFSGGDVTCNCNVERTCNLKNMYVFDHVKKEWISLPRAELSYGDGGPQYEDQTKYGAHSFGATEEYFWGSTGGKVDDQKAYDAASVKSQMYTINQPDQPTLGAPAVSSLFLSSQKKLSWKFTQDSTPQLAYKLSVEDLDGQVIYEKYATRPEVRYEMLKDLDVTSVKCTLTVTDVFGAETTAVFMTDAYKEAKGITEETNDPAGDPANNGSADQAKTADKAKTSSLSNFFKTAAPGMIALSIVLVCLGGALVVGGAVAAVLIILKKKKA